MQKIYCYTLLIGFLIFSSQTSNAKGLGSDVLCNDVYDTLTIAACNSYSSPSGKYVWTSSGTYADTLPLGTGCDSILTIYLTVSKGTSNAIIDKSVIDDGLSGYTPPPYLFCEDRPPIKLAGYPYGGSWTAGQSQTVVNGTFYPEKAVPEQPFYIKYTYLPGTQCESKDSAQVEIEDKPELSLTPLDTCIPWKPKIEVRMKAQYKNSPNVDWLGITGGEITPLSSSSSESEAKFTAQPKKGVSTTHVIVVNTKEGNACPFVSGRVIIRIGIRDDMSFVQRGDSLVATGDADSYQWVDCDSNFARIPGANKRFFIPVKNGNYGLIVRTDSCEKFIRCHPYIIGGIHEPDQKLNIVPNPSSGSFQFHLPSTLSGSFNVFNQQGQLVLHKTFEASQKPHFNLDLKSGVYLASVQTEDMQFFRTKLVIIN